MTLHSIMAAIAILTLGTFAASFIFFGLIFGLFWIAGLL